MAGPRGTERAGIPVERLRITPWSALRAVAMLGGTLVVLRVIDASTRVIGWILAAAVAASLLHPLIDALGRRIPRWAAVLVVLVGLLGSAGLVGYRLVDTIVRETENLQRAAPEVARELERSERWGELARNFELVDRTQSFVDDIPARLRGGTPAEAVRSAATRGVAFLATGVLTLFFVLYGPRIVSGALDQIGDEHRRRRVATLGARAHRRAVRYALDTVLLAVAAGLFADLVAGLAGVRGAAALGVWVALWDVVPVVGALIGALPVIALAAVISAEHALWVAVAFVAWQAFEYAVVQRRIERRSVHVGPFLTLAAGLAGIELYGLGGGLLALFVVVLAVAVGDEVLPR